MQMSGLGSGSYSVVISDANGCSEEVLVEITEPDELLVSAEISDVSCFGLSDGSATAQAIGGTAPYSYSWSNEIESEVILDVPADMYMLTVFDDNGCSSEAYVQISEPEAIVNTVTNEGNLLIADQNGSEYQWFNCKGGFNPIPGATAQTFPISQSGVFAVEVRKGDCVEMSECTEVSTLSIDDTEDKASIITLYPNPTNRMLNIDLSGTDLNQGAIRLFDVSGKLVKSVSINRDLVLLDLGELSTGVYVVDIEGVRKKVVVTD